MVITANQRITVTVSEAAKMYGLCENSFRRLVNRRDFPMIKVGRRIVIITGQLMAYMEQLAEKDSVG